MNQQTLSAREVAAAVLDPELPVLTLEDLGVLRSVEERGGWVVVTITPTYTGCPALAEMRADLRRRLHAAGYRDVDVRTVLSPAWTTDWITEAGRRKLTDHGIAPPAPIDPRRTGPVPLDLRAPGGPPISTLPGGTDVSRRAAGACGQPGGANGTFDRPGGPPISTLPASTNISGQPLNLTPPATTVPCPRCGSADTTELSRFSSTACKALRRCESCREPFEHVKEI